MKITKKYITNLVKEALETEPMLNDKDEASFWKSQIDSVLTFFKRANDLEQALEMHKQHLLKSGVGQYTAEDIINRLQNDKRDELNNVISQVSEEVEGADQFQRDMETGAGEEQEDTIRLETLKNNLIDELQNVIQNLSQVKTVEELSSTVINIQNILNVHDPMRDKQ